MNLRIRRRLRGSLRLCSWYWTISWPGIWAMKASPNPQKLANFKDHNADKQKSMRDIQVFWIRPQPTLLFLEYPSLIFSTALHRYIRYIEICDFASDYWLSLLGPAWMLNKFMEVTKIVFLLKENIHNWTISQWKCQEQRKEIKKLLNSLKQSRAAYVLSG